MKSPYYLFDPTSLTEKLQKAAKEHFTVKVIAEGFVLVMPQTVVQLELKGKQMVWQRVVALCVDDEPWVLAKTFIPLPSLQGKGRQLLYLKNRPLGKVLFRDPHLKRSAFEVRMSQEGPVRYSVFNFYGAPLLVAETFLSKAVKYFSGS